MNMTQVDVVIVGGSIAGCTAAMLFARKGLRVALVERQANPEAFKRICTHYIHPSAVPIMERLGITDALDEAGAVKNGLEIWTRWGWIRAGVGERTPSHGYNVRRQTLDPILRQAAATTPGVELCAGWAASALLRDGAGRPTGVVIEKGGDKMELRGRLVVAADGRNSKLGELAGVPVRVSPNNRFTYYAYYRDLPLASGTRSQFWVCEPDVGYAFPNDGDLTLVLASPTMDKLPAFRKDLDASFLSFFDPLPLAPRLREGRRVSDWLGMVHIPNLSRPAAAPGIAFIGDAAMAADPLPGVGCSWAFHSAAWLVEATAEALVGRHDVDRELDRYRRLHRWRMMTRFAVICEDSLARGLTPLHQLLFSAGAKDPAIAEHVQSFIGCLSDPARLLSPAALCRSAWVNLTRRNVQAELPDLREAGAPATIASTQTSSKIPRSIGGRGEAVAAAEPGTDLG